MSDDFKHTSFGKTRGADFEPLALLPRLLPIYAEVLQALASAGAAWVQIDEPVLALDRLDALCAITVGASTICGGNGIPRVGRACVAAHLSIGVHARVADVTPAWVAL